MTKKNVSQTISRVLSLSRAVLYHIYNIGAKWREANHLSARHVAVSLYRSTLRRSLPVGGSIERVALCHRFT